MGSTPAAARLAAVPAFVAALAFGPASLAAPPSAGGCPVFPANNVWNARVDALPVHPQSDAWVAAIGAARPLHPDFRTVWNGAPNGIPWVVAPPGTKGVAVRFEYEWHDAAGQWFRTHGNEHWEFDARGLMRRRDMSANDVPIAEHERRLR